MAFFVKNWKFYDQIIIKNIEKNDLLQIVSIKSPYYSKFYADSNAKKNVFDFNHYILRYK